MRQQQQAPSTPIAQTSSQMSHLNDEMGAVGEMELDDAVGHMELDDNQRSIQQTRELFGQQQRPQLHLNSSGLAQGLRTSQPTTPASATFGFHNNPTVSSVNTPTLTTQQGMAQRGQQSSQESVSDDDEIPGMPLNMNLSNMNLNSSQFGGLNFGNIGTIHNPAKQLYTPGGPTQMTSEQRAFEKQLQLQQQLQQLGIDINQFANADPASQNLILQQMASLMIPAAEEPKAVQVPGYRMRKGLQEPEWSEVRISYPILSYPIPVFHLVSPRGGKRKPGGRLLLFPKY